MIPESEERRWHHSPVHRFVPNAMYMVTAGTFHKEHYLNTPERKTLLLETLLGEAENFGWTMQAWSVFSNHYHFIAEAPEGAESLKRLLQAVHSRTARVVNKEDKASGRTVWRQYWDTCITYERSYWPRLRYVHENPAKHGVVKSAELYPWCSMAWFLRESPGAFREKVLSYECDKVRIADDF